MPAALVLFAHGARDPQWSAPFYELRERIATRRPSITVELAFLELMTPTLESAIEQLAARDISRIVVAPLFMAQGGHLKRDVPVLLDRIRTACPQLSLTLAPPLGEVETVLEAIVSWGATLIPEC